MVVEPKKLTEMKTLQDILTGVEVKEHRGALDVEITSVQIDSRKVVKGSVFVAIEGTIVDGHSFIQTAVGAGAIVIVCTKMPENTVDNVTYILVEDSGYACSVMLSSYYNNPSSKMKVIGITGTNGKTTTVTLLHRMFRKLGYQAGLLSTVVNYIGDTEIEATHTTPDPVQLYALLNQMVEAGCEFCFMEVSSHAIHQNRTAGITFAGGIFTNITRDHLDYHKTFDEYIAVKKRFFDTLPEGAFALVNGDDKNGAIMLQNTKAIKRTYSLRSFSDYKCRVMETDFTGMLLAFDGVDVWVKFIGLFNAYNLLSVYAVALELGQSKDDVLAVISEQNAVDGRFECFRSVNNITGIVDYAHTHDALDNVLNTISELRTRNEQVITVVGAGGDRDKGKRPIMAKVAVSKSDKVILTADNPRSEDAETICEEMRAGVDASEMRKVLTIVDRREAIRTAVFMAQPNDIILIAGKGHETYQIVKGVKSHFDDREELQKVFDSLQLS